MEISIEEKKAIEQLKHTEFDIYEYCCRECVFKDNENKTCIDCHDKMKNILLNLIEKQQKEIEKHKNTIARYEMESKSFRAFCRKIRKTEKRNVDEFNQGREYSYIQFLNLINGEQNWEHEGKYFDEVDEELEKWAERK